MKTLTWLVLMLLVGPSVGASPNAEEFVIEDIDQITEIKVVKPTTNIIKIKKVKPVRPLPQPAPSPVATKTAKPSKLIQVVQGAASWYGPGFYGRTTASGERFQKGTLTAAHRTLPFGTRVRVTNLSNGRSVVVRINDRGPFKYHRVIDLAHGAASQLKMMQAGEVPVKLEILK
jgi:rare lipoprotein A